MRCFIGAFLGAESAQRLQTACAGPLAAPGLPSGARAVPLENYHLTLRFLGETADSEVPAILERVRLLAVASAVVHVARLAGLPRPGKARVVVAELAPHPHIEAWHTQLEESLAAQDRRFRPHVTVARYRYSQAFPAFSLATPLELELTAPGLYRSDSTPRGVRYRRVATERDG